MSENLKGNCCCWSFDHPPCPVHPKNGLVEAHKAIDKYIDLEKENAELREAMKCAAEDLRVNAIEAADLRKLVNGMLSETSELCAFLKGYKTALEAERSVKNDLSIENGELREYIEEIRSELNDLKWLHDQACNLVIPGDVDSPEAYRILLKQMREVLGDCVCEMKFLHEEYGDVCDSSLEEHAEKLKKWGLI